MSSTQVKGTILQLDAAIAQLQPPPPPAACLVADHPRHDVGGPGCTDVTCCAAVCAIDPFCCDTQWDSICADEARSLCPGCGAPFGEDEAFGMAFTFSVDPPQLSSTQLVVTDTLSPSAGNPSQPWLEAPIVGALTPAIVTLNHIGPGSPQLASVQIDNVTHEMVGMFGPVSTIDDLFPNVSAFSPIGTLAFSSPLDPIQVLMLGPAVAVVAKDEQCHNDSGPKIANKVETLPNGATTWVDEKAALTGENGLTAGDLDMLKMMRVGGDGTQCGDTTDSYNCHGRTFACGMKWICNDQVDPVLMKNGYTEQPLGKARVGDVCVFRDAGGGVIHTETVTEVFKGARHQFAPRPRRSAGAIAFEAWPEIPSYDSPMHPAAERIAIRAAQIMLDGAARDVGHAIALAVERLDAPPSAAPSAGRVRQHLQPMLMQALGADGYAAMTRRRLEVAEEVMTVLAERVDVLDVVLVGRAAAGHLDGDVALHIRVYTRRRIGDLAQDLVDVGFAEPRFATADTRLGRLDRLVFADGDVDVVVTRCLPAQRGASGNDLFTGRPAPHVRIATLRAALAARAQ